MILHITTPSAWAATQVDGYYRADSLASEGFIHCSTPRQILGVANDRFRGQAGLLLLVIDPERVPAAIVYEDCYESGQQFPHIYGLLPGAAVVAVIDFPVSPDGTFAWPPALNGYGLTPGRYPILDIDAAPEAFIEPGKLLPAGTVPEHAVMCFFQDVITKLKEAGELTHLYDLGSEIGLNPVYRWDGAGQPIALMHPGVGAPLAGAFLEELIALGARRIVLCGGAGALDKELTLGHLVVPTAAIRDEGLSYHYLPPGAEVAVRPRVVAAVEAALTDRGVPYVTGKTWTTDAVYRETPALLAQRRAQGAITVEMEAAGMLAVAEFRDVDLGYILYSGDNLAEEVWDNRGWQRQTSLREKLLRLAAAAVLRL